MRKLACLVVFLGLSVVLSWSVESVSVAALDNAQAKTNAEPVPVNMHDFMEGVFQAPYRRLKAGMAAEPKDAAAWKVIRSDALILAEGGNLLLMRKPEKDADLWTQYSVEVRDAGSELVKAAKAKDFPASRRAYEGMLTHCNACHKKFEEGRHILTP